MNYQRMAKQHVAVKVLAMCKTFKAPLMLLVIVAASLSVQGPELARASTQTSSCFGPHYQDFMFWVGSWNVFDVADGRQVARAEITSILNGCAIEEDYRALDGGRGISLSSWNAQSNLWKQHWVSDKGATASIEGGLGSTVMVLIGTDDTAEAHYQLRGVWKREGKNVRETAWRSRDGGRTWKEWFDIRFVPRSDHP